jgi:Kdo2-lipid IVA lauroyltransferase/acyltransferase
MQAISYYLLLPLLYFISILPFPILYGVSNFVYVLLFYVFGYRKKVVYTNLRNSFPEKSEAEIIRIQKNYFKFLADLLVEVFKSLTISNAQLAKRCSYTPETAVLLNSLIEKHQNVVIVLGHHGNWEWAATSFGITQKHKLWGVYVPLKNKYFNNMVVRMRSRFGTGLIPIKENVEYIERLSQTNNFALGLIADQTPRPERAHWMTFLNQDTPVYLGAEKFSQKLNYPVVYMSITRVKRGHYTVAGELLVENPRNCKPGEITEIHTKRLEQDIIRDPDVWAWSHKRWKHKRPVAPQS